MTQPYPSNPFYNGEFSFHQNSFDDSKRNTQLREDLMGLTKQQIIEILLEQINENKTFRVQAVSSQQFSKQKNTQGYSRNINYQSNKPKEYSKKSKISMDHSTIDVNQERYEQILQYMNQYISNTQEAQKHFFMVIDDLKNQNVILKGQILQIRNSQRRKNHDNTFGINVDDYLRINNQLSVKLQKVSLQKNALENQCQNLKEKLIQSDKNNKHESFEGAFNEIIINKDFSAGEDVILKDYSTVNNESNQNFLKKALKIMEIQNKELRDSLLKAQNMLAKKSQKIRNLLSELERVSEEKWIYKQKILDWKSKCMEYESHSNKVQSKTYEQSNLSSEKCCSSKSIVNS